MRAIIFGFMVLAPGVARAGVIQVAPTDDLRAMLATAQAGDEYVLAAGTYDLGTVRTAISVLATSAEPVVIHSAAGVRAIISRVSAGQDLLVIENSSHVTLRDLELVGGNAGVRIDFSDDITVQNCIIHGANGAGVVVDKQLGSASQVAHSNIVVRGNELYDSGAASGFAVRLGCDEALTCSAPGVVVEGNYIHGIDLGGSGGGIRIGASANAGVRDNVVHDTGGPGIAMVGDCTGSVVARNAVFRIGNVGIQMAHGVDVHDNIVIGSTSFGLGTVVGAASVADLQITNNTVVAADGLLLNQPQLGVLVANNALYAGDVAVQQVGAANATFINNVGTGMVAGAVDAISAGGTLAQAFTAVNADGTGLDAYPRAGGPLVGTGNATQQPIDDYNGTTRGSTHDVGAYAFADTGNPRPRVSDGFKGSTVGGDGAGGDGDSGPGGGAQQPPQGGGPIGGGAAKSEDGCVAALAVWPVVMVLGVWLTRPRRRPRA